MPACEKCGSDAGNPYSFLFGTSSVVSRQIAQGAAEAMSAHRIVATDTALLCAACVARDHRRELAISLAVSALLTVGAAGAIVLGYAQSGTASETAGIGLLLIGIVLALLAVGAILATAMRLMTGPATAGEELAIRLHRRVLLRRGFDAFWTHEAWQDQLDTATRSR